MALIYVIEDDDSIREIEELALKNAGHNVVSFPCAKDFYQTLSEKLPDLCLVDIMLPDENGNEIVKKLRRKAETKTLPLIMVTAKSSELDLVRGIEDGADDYIKKPFSIMELISRVKALLRRTKNSEDKAKELQLDELLVNNEKHEVSISGKVIELTYKEYELLSLFILNKGIVLSRDTIMDKVWGMDYVGETRTIEMHVRTLRQKLQDYGNRIRTVRNVGYVME